MASFQCARIERMLLPRAALQDIFASKATDSLPALNTSHLSSMTDDTGMLQHAIFYGVRSAGFSVRTTFRSHFTMQQLVAAETAFIPIVSMKIRERNQRFPS
jgi:hypothetical protein